MLRGNAERIGHAIEKRKHRGDVDRLGDLWIGPAVVAQNLHVPCVVLYAASVTFFT